MTSKPRASIIQIIALTASVHYALVGGIVRPSADLLLGLPCTTKGKMKTMDYMSRKASRIEVSIVMVAITLLLALLTRGEVIRPRPCTRRIWVGVRRIL